MSLQKPRAFDNRKNTSYKGKGIDSSHASTSKSKMFYEKKAHSFSKNNVSNYNKKIKDSWKNKFQASMSKNSSITCYYCDLTGHRKIDCKKRVNDLKAKSYQPNRRMVNKKNPRKMTFFQTVEQENLEKIKRLTQSKLLITKQIWVKKGELKCLVVHTTLKATKTSHWYLDSGCSRNMTGDKSLVSHYVLGTEGSVAFSDGNTAKIMGRGIVEIPRVLTLKARASHKKLT